MCSVLVTCFDAIVIYSCLKLYLGCAIPFGERKPYVDFSDPSQYATRPAERIAHSIFLVGELVSGTVTVVVLFCMFLSDPASFELLQLCCQLPHRSIRLAKLPRQTFKVWCVLAPGGGDSIDSSSPSRCPACTAMDSWTLLSRCNLFCAASTVSC